MASASRPRSPGPARRKFPVGIPVQPPPGWRPRQPLPPLPPPASPFRSQFGLVIQAMLLGLMVFVCTTVGWLWTKAPRRGKPGERVAVKATAPPQKKAPVVPAAPVPETLPPSAVPSPPVEEPRPRPEPPRPRPSPPPPPATGVLTYAKDILPIMQRACLSCHGVMKKRGGLDLRTFAALARGGDSGIGVKPGKPDEGSLMESIVSGRMPPKPAKKLSAAEKQLIRDWIASGAKAR